ncbi:DJ-1/PfpI family protein [Mycoplasma todarodis]|nr:DJ-1/PfpI family protein [Mycoplasma todarodis]
MKNIAILVADGFEDTELIGAIDFWTREEIDFDLISIHNKKEVKGSYFAKIDTIPIDGINFDNYEHLFIPGGKSGVHFQNFNRTTEIILDFYNKNKGVFAICAAPLLLHQANILKDKTFTCWPGLNLPKSTNSECEISGNVITGRDYLSTISFAKEVSKYIKK